MGKVTVQIPKMNRIFRGFEFIQVYISDLLIKNKGDWSDHLEKLELTPQNLKGNRLKCYIKKLFFGQTDMEYIRFWVTPTGTGLVNKKV